MDDIALYLPAAVVAITAVAVALGPLRSRLELSKAKHPSISGHARWSQRLARLIPFYGYDEERFFRSDDSPDNVAALRRAGFARLSLLFRERFARSAVQTTEAAESVSDLQFTS